MKREIVTAETIRLALAKGLPALIVAKGAIVTPQAKDLVMEKNFSLQIADSDPALPRGAAGMAPAGSCQGSPAGVFSTSSTVSAARPLPPLPALEKRNVKAAASNGPAGWSAGVSIPVPGAGIAGPIPGVTTPVSDGSGTPATSGGAASASGASPSILLGEPYASPPKKAPSSDVREAVRRAVLERLPEAARADDLVRRLVDKALSEASAHKSGSGCGACSGPCSCNSSAPLNELPPGPGRSTAGRVVAVDSHRLPWEKFPGAATGTVNIVDVITPKDGSPMGGGYLEWDAVSFPWHLTYAELDVVLEGELHISSDGKTVVGRPGDMLFIPADTHVIFSSPGYVKFAYAVWPADWSGTAAPAEGA